MSVFIIAEVGVNHNGDVRIAEKMIEKAACCGCDAVKFQNFHTEKLVTKGAEKANYQKENTRNLESQFLMLKNLELADEEFIYIKTVCERNNIEFMSTPFDESSVDLLERIGVGRYKISSGDLTNKRLIQYIAKKMKPLILSTGMADEDEIEDALAWSKEKGNSMVTLLHCTSNYPTKFEDVNLGAMHTLEQHFHVPVGYSDHTLGIEIPIMAVALGATVIEKHVTLCKELPGPDHVASLDMDQMKKMVQCIRNVEKAFGNGIKTPSENELETRKAARKSVVVTKNLQAGHILSVDDLDIKRPGDGILPKYIDMLYGKRLLKAVSQDTTLHFEDIES